jgi:D-alanine-D-alanine ligase
MPKTHVGLIYGGQSPEHEVSVDSAHNVFEVFDRDEYRVTPIRIDPEGRWHVETPDTAALRDPDAPPRSIEEQHALFSPATGDGSEIATSKDSASALDPLDLDVAFPMLHGPNGEDGRVQGLLRTLGIPFVGADVLGSATCMDKEVAKRMMRDADLPVVPFRVLRYGDERIPFVEVQAELGDVLFVKPANAGSSVGTAKVTSEDEYHEAADAAFDYDNKVLVEAAIDGREIECAVLGNGNPRASTPGEIVSTAQFYTYEAKYDAEADQAHMEVPAEGLPDALLARVQDLATRAYHVLGCEGMGRVDFFVTEAHQMFINEINTIPGFTERSMYPVMWEHMNMPQSELLSALIQLALDRHERDARIKTKR